MDNNGNLGPPSASETKESPTVTNNLLDEVDPYLDVGSQPFEDREQTGSVRNGFRTRYRMRLWIREILALGFSAIIMATMVLVLELYNHQVVPDWRLNINTVVSILTNTLRAAVMYSVANVIGQAKVNHPERFLPILKTHSRF